MQNPNVVSFSTNDTTGKTARFTVGTDIIDYMESSRTFGREDLADPKAHGRFQRRMVAIPDKKGNVVTPMVLTISNQNQLYLVRKDDESKSGDGWKLIDLSQAFKGIVGDSMRVHAHSAAWTGDDKITIAVAVDDGTSERSRVFVACDLSSRESDWENIQWIDCGSREDVRVAGIRVLDGGDGVWTIVLAGDRVPNDMLYLLRGNAKQSPQSFARALIFNPAVTLEEILDFEVAVLPLLGCGIAVLGIGGGTRSLSFRPFPAYKADGSFDSVPPVEPLPCPDGANVLETGLTKEVAHSRRLGAIYGSDIYVGGQGINQIKARDIYQVQGSGEGDIGATVVTPPELAPNVQDLIVGDAPDGSASVRSLLQNGDLNVVKKAADENWGEPLRLRVGVQAIAPVHGDEQMTTSLLVVYANGQAGFLCREASQGIWQERPLVVADPEEVTPITCYSTNLRVLSDSSLPKPNVKVTVTASVLSSVVLNGNAVFIGPELSYETETDFNGSITLYDRVRSFTPAIYRFKIEGFDQCIDVNPASSVHERFKNIKADELREATICTKEGEEPEPLLPESFRTGADQNKVDMLAGSLNQVSSFANSANGVVAGVCLVDCNSPFSSTLRADTVPDDYRWAIHADEHGVKTIVGDAIDWVLKAAENVGNFIKNVGEGIVDFFEGLIHGVQEGGITGGITFIIHKTKEAAKSVFKFVCKIGDKVKSFVLNTLEQVGSAIKWLWKQCKIGLEKVWNFLKFLFDWDDILRVRDLLVRATDVAIDRIKGSIEPMKKGVETTFDQLIETIENWKDVENRRPKEDQSSSLSSMVKDKTDDETQKKMDQANGNSAISWIFEKFQNILDEVIEIKTPDPDLNLQNAVTEFFERSFKTAWDEISKSFNQIKDIFSNAFKDDLPDVEDISIGWIFDKISYLIKNVGSEVLGTALRTIKGLILKLFHLIQDLISFGRNLMFAEVRFPFIEKLLKWITGKSVSSEFRLIDAVALLVAVPTTITYKILFGEDPIKAGDVISIPFDPPIFMIFGKDPGDYKVVTNLDEIPIDKRPITVQSKQTFSDIMGRISKILSNVTGFLFCGYQTSQAFKNPGLAAIPGKFKKFLFKDYKQTIPFVVIFLGTLGSFLTIGEFPNTGAKWIPTLTSAMIGIPLLLFLAYKLLQLNCLGNLVEVIEDIGIPVAIIVFAILGILADICFLGSAIATSVNASRICGGIASLKGVSPDVKGWLLLGAVGTRCLAGGLAVIELKINKEEAIMYGGIFA